MVLKLIGNIFGRLTVISYAGSNDKRSFWNCLCICGKECVVMGKRLRKGQVKSCGCLRSDSPKERNTTHGMTNSPEFKAWQHIKERCYNKNAKEYKHYGGRGIGVCEAWRDSFDRFFKDMGIKPSPKHSIDRINNQGNYEPENCRWATYDMQASNKRNNVWIEHLGVKMIISHWANCLNTSPTTISTHLKKKPFSEIFDKFDKKNKVDYDYLNFRLSGLPSLLL